MSAAALPISDTPESLLHCLLDFGELMLSVGAEVNRVEDTLERLGLAYGAARMNVFVITSSMVVTMSLPDGRDLTQTRRILSPGGTDFSALEALNALSRRCCRQPLCAADLAGELAAVRRSRVRPAVLYFGSALAAGSCTLFFGGHALDSLSAALFGLVICFLQQKLSPECPNRMVFNLLSALAVGTGISLWSTLSPLFHMDLIMIGDIMLLIPGVAMSNAVRDMMVGSPISGAMRLIETLLWAAALAMGFMSGIWLMGGLGQ